MYMYIYLESDIHVLICRPISTYLGFLAELGNIPWTYLHYRVCKFSHGGRFIGETCTGHCYLAAKRAVLNINSQSTLSVLSSWISEVILPWVPPFSFHVDTFEGCFPALGESPEKLRLICRYGCEFPKWAIFLVYVICLAKTFMSYELLIKRRCGSYQSTRFLVLIACKLLPQWPSFCVL